MYKIILKTDTKRDLAYISDIIYRFTFSDKSVDKVYKEILTNIFGLQIFPYRYVEYKFGFRVLIIKGKYKVFYKIDEDKHEVQVYRILFSSSSYKEIF